MRQSKYHAATFSHATPENIKTGNRSLGAMVY
jgi:hypothetical protein